LTRHLYRDLTTLFEDQNASNHASFDDNNEDEEVESGISFSPGQLESLLAVVDGVVNAGVT
jgi:hypothetical protein